MNDSQVAVSSRSFSRDPFLRAELLKRYPKACFNERALRLQGDQLVDFFKDAEKVIIGLEKIDADLLSKLPKLKVVSKVGVGLDKIDQAAMAHYEVALANTPGANKRSVAELVLGLSINLLRHLYKSNQRVLSGQWEQDKGYQLSGRKIGIVGFGAIGKEVAKLFTCLDCSCFYYDPINSAEMTAKRCSNLEELLTVSDIVSLHLPLNTATRHLLNEKMLGLMKPDAILINAARGGLVDEEALKQRLKSGQLAAAAFDVFEQEPPIDTELIHLPNFFATAHVGGSTEEAVRAMGLKAIEGLETARIPSGK